MKTIGLLGGMSWESSIEYYRIINQEVKRRLGGTHSAKIIMNSLDFHQVEKLQHQGKWDKLTDLMIDETKKLKAAGVDFVVICTNTMHRMASDIEREVNIPILHIADATANAIKSAGLSNVALLGTNYTMEQNFYKGRLVQNHGLNVVTPNKEDKDQVHHIIYNELILGVINENSKKKYLEIIKKLEKEKAQGVILGCTEIGLLVKRDDVEIPVFDTTQIHALAAVEEALNR